MGLIIQNNLSWDKHISELCRQLSHKVFQLGQLRKSGADFSLLLIFYKTFILSKIDFGISAWGCTTEKNLNKVQRLQNRAARHILGIYDYRNVRGLDLVNRLGLPTVTERKNYFLRKLVIEATRGFAPQHLCNLITMRIDLHPHNTRSQVSDDVHIPLVRKEIFQK